MRFVSDTELATLTPAEHKDLASPIPTQVVSNGEFTPLPQVGSPGTELEFAL